MKFLQRWKQTALHNKALVLTGVLVAAGTLFYAGAAIFQICLMKHTAKQAAVQTERLIAEANRIANSFETTLEQTKKSLDASIEMARRDQRAWIGPIEVTPAWRDAANNPIYIKEGAPAVFGVVIVNSGKSPALKVKSKIKFIVLPAEREFAPNYNKIQSKSVVVIQPEMRMTMKTAVSPRAVTASDINIIKNGGSIVYLFGEITYEDVFKIPHLTTFCMTLAPTLDSFIAHKTYNDAN
jgi:hypothetical protein